MSKVKGQVKEYRSSGRHGPIIKCGDEHLTEIPNRGWIDLEFPQMKFTLPADGGNKFCDGTRFGFTYQVMDRDVPAVVVLCDTGKPAYSHPYVGIFTDWNIPMEGLDLTELEDFLSMTILHEFLHAIDDTQCKL